MAENPSKSKEQGESKQYSYSDSWRILIIGPWLWFASFSIDDDNEESA